MYGQGSPNKATSELISKIEHLLYRLVGSLGLYEWTQSKNKDASISLTIHFALVETRSRLGWRLAFVYLTLGIECCTFE
jgi:hypothetical protein